MEKKMMTFEKGPYLVRGTSYSYKQKVFFFFFGHVCYNSIQSIDTPIPCNEISAEQDDDLLLDFTNIFHLMNISSS